VVVCVEMGDVYYAEIMKEVLELVLREMSFKGGE
jgi:hypothetical protein